MQDTSFCSKCHCNEARGSTNCCLRLRLPLSHAEYACVHVLLSPSNSAVFKSWAAVKWLRVLLDEVRTLNYFFFFTVKPLKLIIIKQVLDRNAVQNLILYLWTAATWNMKFSCNSLYSLHSYWLLKQNQMMYVQRCNFLPIKAFVSWSVVSYCFFLTKHCSAVAVDLAGLGLSDTPGTRRYFTKCFGRDSARLYSVWTLTQLGIVPVQLLINHSLL